MASTQIPGNVREPRFAFALSLAAALIIIASAPTVQTYGAPRDQAEAARAAEARLRARMAGYWDAMQRSDYEAAAQFVHPDSRKLFAFEVPKSRVVRWKIDKLSFNSDLTGCDTVTIVSKPIPYREVVMDWPLHNDWVLADGECYYKVGWEKANNPVL
jgi:hypothetical protein